jgi:hypothetical protein
MERPSFPRFLLLVWHNWEACFGTTFAVVLALAQYSILAWADPKRVPEFVKQFPPQVWLAIGLVLLFWSCYLAWKEQGAQTAKAEAELEDERSIKNAPEIRLDFQKVPGGFSLVVSNKSADKNADAVFVQRIETNRLMLDVERVDFLGAGADIAPKVRMLEKADGSQYMDADYDKLFEDVCEDVGFEARVAARVTYRRFGYEFRRNVIIATNLVELGAAARGMSGSPFKIEHGEIEYVPKGSSQ